MTTLTLQVDSLVLYKQRPARVTNLGEKKLDIQTEAGETISLRPKDVLLLHPGPLRSLRDLPPARANSANPISGEVLTAWELLAGSQTVSTSPEMGLAEYSPPGNSWQARRRHCPNWQS